MHSMRDEIDRLRVTVKMLQDDRDTAQKLRSDATQALGRMEVERDALRERVAVLEPALTAALEVMDDLPTWSNAGHACALARAALKGER